jgi:hypothetical protein
LGGPFSNHAARDIALVSTDFIEDGNLLNRDNDGDYFPADNNFLVDNNETRSPAPSSLTGADHNMQDHIHNPPTLMIPSDAMYHPRSHIQGSFALDAQMEVYIKILCFLDKIQAPIKAFDKLTKLLSELHDNQFNFAGYHKKRKSILQQVTKLFPIAKTECVSVELKQPPKK